MIDPLTLPRLLQLASPMLPVGAYAYSQGLEEAVDAGIVTDAASAEAWIGDVFHLSICPFELPILARLYRAWSKDPDSAASWNAYFLAGRETAEARAETVQMGYSLTSLLRDLDTFGPDLAARLEAMAPVSFPLAFAAASVEWRINEDMCLQTYAWAWLENQVAAAMKTVPLGQVAGQRMLQSLAAAIPKAVHEAADRPDEALCNLAPGLAIAGARHETQYSRLFRS